MKTTEQLFAVELLLFFHVEIWGEMDDEIGFSLLGWFKPQQSTCTSLVISCFILITCMLDEVVIL